MDVRASDREILFVAFSLQLGYLAPEEVLKGLREGGGAVWEHLSPERQDTVLKLVDQAVASTGGNAGLARRRAGVRNTEVDEALVEELVTVAGVGLDATLRRLGVGTPRNDTLLGVVTHAEIHEVSREAEGRYVVAADREVELGRGGLGRVYVRWDRHLEREVAVKELLPSAVDYDAHFIHEARVTGNLEHPSIVPVHELGRRPDGRLYYTMKWVRGRTLASALADRRTLGARLGLLDAFVDVAQALAYAHSRGVIHRDVKPDNVLLGAFGETLLVDWGLAVAVDGQPGALSELPITSSPHLDTDGEIVGTPRYMSPEQARGDASARSPRSDVWSLGAVLFELLTGEVPHEEGTSMNILQRAQSQPPPPVRSVAPGVPPDLAAICDKALASEPADRYPTARELAEEVRAFIAGERVRAYDYTPWEVIRRFVGQRPALAAVSALLLLTVVGSAGLNYRAYLRAEASRQAAERDAATAQTTIDFLVDIFELADPEQARGRSITAREILETGARRVEEQLAGQPEVRARLISTIGVVYRNLGLLHEAVPLLEDGLASARKQGDRHELARRLEALAQARMGLQEPKVAVALLEEALRLREELFGPHAVELLPSLTGLMACVGQLDQNQALARDLSERALAIVEASPSTRSAQVAEALTEIGVMLFMLNRRQEASEVKARSLNIYRELYPRGHPDVAVALHNYATSLVYSFRIDQAVPIFEESMAMAQRMLGPDSLVRGESLNSLGEVYWQRGEHDRATKLMEEARGIFERLMGVESQPYLNATQNLGRVLNSMGRFQDAQELLQATFEVVRRNFPDRPLMHGEYLEVLSQVATRLGEAERGEQLAREGLTLVEPAVDPTHWRLARMRVALGSALGGQGRWSEAEAVFLRAHRDAQWKGRTAKYLSYLYEQLDRPREKEAYDAIMKKFDIPRSPNPLFGPVP